MDCHGDHYISPVFQTGAIIKLNTKLPKISIIIYIFKDMKSLTKLCTVDRDAGLRLIPSGQVSSMGMVLANLETLSGRKWLETPGHTKKVYVHP